ncbi:MAG: cadherin-like domain-containing protein, partial [Cellvibrionales bacterium]|nr:cadherin-like domain-containing protein [Cellvibrionales bacterium]
MKKTDSANIAKNVYLTVNNKKSVCLTDLDRYQLDCQNLDSLTLTDGQHRLPANVIVRRIADDLQVDVMTSAGQKSVLAKDFYSDAASKDLSLPLAHPTQPDFKLDATTEAYAQLADGSQVIYLYGDQNILSEVIEDYSIDHYYELGKPSPEQLEKSENGQEFTWLGLGLGTLAIIGVASAATLGGIVYVNNRNEGSSPNQEQIDTELLTREVSGNIVLGPLVEGHGLKVELYDQNDTLLTTAVVGVDGNYNATIGKAIEQVKAKVIDTNDAADYIDEATGQPKDIDGQLSAWNVINLASDAITLNINPLTSLASAIIEKKLDAADNSLTAQQAIQSINNQVTKAFLGEDADITTYAINPVVDQDGKPVEGNAGGAVLSMISALEDKDGISTADVVNSLADNLATDTGEILMTGEVLQRLNEAKVHLGDSFDAVTDAVIQNIQQAAEAVNQLPLTESVNLSIAEDQVFTFTEAAFVFTDADAKDSLQSIKIVTLPTKGALFVAGIPATIGQVVDKDDLASLTFQAAPDENGANYTEFTFSVGDGIGFSAPQKATINVTAVNDLPVSSVNNLGAIDEEGRLSFTAADLLAEASDAEGDTISVMSVSVPDSQGMLEITDAGWIFVAAKDFAGEVTLTVTLSDGQGETDITASIEVNNLNDAPEAQSDGFIIEPVIPVLTNDTTGVQVNASSEASEAESVRKAFDADAATAWQAESQSASVTIQLDDPVSVFQYALSSTPNVSKAPIAWVVSGSFDGENYTPIHTVQNHSDWLPGETKYFDVDSIQPFTFYQFEFTEVNGADKLALSELQLYPKTENLITQLAEAESLVVDVLANDMDADANDSLTLIEAIVVDKEGNPLADKGNVSIVDNKITFSAGEAFSYLAVSESEYVTVAYRISDEAGATSDAQLVLKVKGIDYP